MCGGGGVGRTKLGSQKIHTIQYHFCNDDTVVMPRRRGKCNRLASQPRDHPDPLFSPSALLYLAIYWMYAHSEIALKCIEKLNKLISGYDFLNIPPDHILYWPSVSVLSGFLVLSFVLIVIKFAPALYIIFGDVMFMCIFWVLHDHPSYTNWYK